MQTLISVYYPSSIKKKYGRFLVFTEITKVNEKIRLNFLKFVITIIEKTKKIWSNEEFYQLKKLRTD